ncbi:MAG: hypothetical protein ACP5I4_10415 [Oceanipulchritudo sp.]
MKRKLLFALGLFAAVLSNALALEIGDEPEDKGTFLNLPDGGQLQLFVEENKILAYFIDAEGLIMRPPAESILFIIDDALSDKDTWRTVLSPSDAKMVGSRLLYPPYSFRTKVIVRFADKDPVSFFRTSVDLARNQK